MTESTARESAERRLFVGLALDAELARELAAAAASVFDERAWKHHAPRDLHVTLVFLGDVRAERVAPLERELRARLSRLPAPRLTVQGLGAFPDSDRPRVAWAGIVGESSGVGEGEGVSKGAELDRLVALRNLTLEAVRAAGVPVPDEGPFVPHVTLARPRGRRVWPREAADFSFSRAWRPHQVELFESVGAAGPERYPRRAVADLS